MKTKKRIAQLERRRQDFSTLKGDGPRKRPSGYRQPGSLKAY